VQILCIDQLGLMYPDRICIPKGNLELETIIEKLSFLGYLISVSGDLGATIPKPLGLKFCCGAKILNAINLLNAIKEH